MSGNGHERSALVAGAVAFLLDAGARAKGGFALFERLRAHAPILHVGNGGWLASSYSAVSQLMLHPASTVQLMGNGVRIPITQSPVLDAAFLRQLPYRDALDHRRLRAVVEPMFAPAVANRLRESVRAVAEEMLYPAVFEGGCDVVQTVGARLPVAATSLLLDIPRSDWDQVRTWAYTFYGQLGRFGQTDAEIAAVEAAHHAFADYVRGLANSGSPSGGPSVREAIVSAWKNGQMDEDEMISFFGLFLLTGIETSTHAIGNSVWFLANNPDLFRLLKSNPRLAKPALEETLRLWGPIRLCIRRLSEEVTVDGTTLPAGANVMVLLTAANRDPAQFARPDEFDLERRPNKHLAFGLGAHACLGASVGRLTSFAVFEALLSRCDRLWTTADMMDPKWTPSLPILGLDSVPVFAEPDSKTAV
ncbi:MAG: cytochrome P450 [Minicystis sp.]